ncbi:MAG TPA: hypothetical protein VN878_09195, partial [Usitatibacter sp.]|nr:hypothetical protein [Usitatibacter sp.]
MTDADLSGMSSAPLGPSRGGPAGEPQIGSRITDLEAKLAAAIAEAEKLREDWLRAKAETENVRRRSQEDLAK